MGVLVVLALRDEGMDDLVVEGVVLVGGSQHPVRRPVGEDEDAENAGRGTSGGDFLHGGSNVAKCQVVLNFDLEVEELAEHFFDFISVFVCTAPWVVVAVKPIHLLRDISRHAPSLKCITRE